MVQIILFTYLGMIIKSLPLVMGMILNSRDLMKDAGILDGDTAIIKQADTANNGQIVVALVDNTEATLKVLQKKGEEVWLVPCNSEYQTRKLDAKRVKVQGILSSIIRNYH